MPKYLLTAALLASLTLAGCGRSEADLKAKAAAAEKAQVVETQKAETAEKAKKAAAADEAKKEAEKPRAAEYNPNMVPAPIVWGDGKQHPAAK
jgi:nitrate reductase cytochrome c-type subunit